MLELKNFFEIKEDELKVLNPYDFNKSIQRIKNLTLDDIKNDLNNHQKKEFEFRTYEEEVSYTLKNIRILTSSKNDKNEDEYYELKNLEDYKQPCENKDKNIEEKLKNPKESYENYDWDALKKKLPVEKTKEDRKNRLNLWKKLNEYGMEIAIYHLKDLMFN